MGQIALLSLFDSFPFSAQGAHRLTLQPLRTLPGRMGATAGLGSTLPMMEQIALVMRPQVMSVEDDLPEYGHHPVL